MAAPLLYPITELLAFPHTWKADQTLGDDKVLYFGQDKDVGVVLSSAAIAANAGDTDLPSLFKGTSVHPALAANSIIFSNITADGDWVFLGNRGGNSEAFLVYDSSAGQVRFESEEIYINMSASSREIRFLEDANNAGVTVMQAFIGADPYISIGGGIFSCINPSFFGVIGAAANALNAIITANMVIIASDLGGANTTSDTVLILRNHPITGEGVLLVGTDGRAATVNHWRVELKNDRFVFGPTGTIGEGSLDAGIARLDAALTADTAKTGLLLGTAVGSRQALTVGSWINTSVLANADLGLYVNQGAVSYEAFLADASAGIVYAGMSVIGATTTFQVENRDTTNTASHAAVIVKANNVSADAMVRLVAGETWYMGVDNSAGWNPLSIGTGTAVGTNGILDIIGPTNGVLTSAWTVKITLAATTWVNAAANATSTLLIAASILTFSNTTSPKTMLSAQIQAEALTIVQSGGAMTVNKAAGVASISVTAGTSVTLTHSSAFRALTGGEAVNVSGLFVEAQTAGTTGNYQVLLAVSTGAAPALADHVGITARDFAADDTRLYIASQAGSNIIIGNNTLSLGLAGTGTGVVTMSGATSGIVTVTVAAAAGTWTMTLPTSGGTSGFQLETNGSGVTSWTGAGSRREWKQDILDFTDYRGALAQMLQSPLHTFNYRKGFGTGDYDTRYLGIMADESPWATHFGESIINPVNTVGYMVAGFKAHEDEITSIRGQMELLQERLAVLEGANA